MSNRVPTEASFLADVKQHTMAVLLDKGVYRHLQFKQNGSSVMWFDIVTWPGFLAYSGDMGCFVFSRLKDMFEFFRTRPTDRGEKLFINEGYWSEKLEAVDRCGRPCDYKEFSSERFESMVNEHVDEWIEEWELTEEQAAELREEIKNEVLCASDDGEYRAHEVLRDFSFEQDGHKFEFSDTWEWDLREYTFRFIWCCYALSWAIKQYDAQKETEYVPD